MRLGEEGSKRREDGGAEGEAARCILDDSSAEDECDPFQVTHNW